MKRVKLRLLPFQDGTACGHGSFATPRAK
jgi:hypothetical protein